MESNNDNIICKSIIITNHLIDGDHVNYTLEITLSNNKKYTSIERYSDLLNLHNSMSKEIKSLPKFPPKKMFGNKKESFLIQRQNELNNYFKQITSSDIFINLPSFKNWIQNARTRINSIKKNNKNENNESNFIDSLNQREKIEFVMKKYVKYFVDVGWEDKYETNEDKMFKKSKKYLDVIINSNNFGINKSNNLDVGEDIEENINNEEKEENKEMLELVGNDENFGLIGKRNEMLENIENQLEKKLNDINNQFENNIYSNYISEDLVMSFNI